MSSRGTRHVRRNVVGILALVLSAVLPACDWFKASDFVERASPFLSGLSINPATVTCDQSFVVSFRYDDPQDDISLLLVTFQLTGSSAIRVDQVLWSAGSAGLDLTLAGRARYTTSFPCGTPGGQWHMTVQLEDRGGHTSNILTGTVVLPSAGGG